MDFKAQTSCSSDVGTYITNLNRVIRDYHKKVVTYLES